MSMKTQMKRLEVKGLVKAYGDIVAVNNVSFSVYDGEFFALLGPSGCGKTTVLRCIVGLERIDKGEILVTGQKVSSAYDRIFVPPERRGMSMVFQSYAVWPHLTVAENVAYGLEIKKLPKGTIREKVAEVLDLVGLADKKDRYTTKLSGGEQQRVALARSLVVEPDVILLDEPLSNLDAKLRAEMRSELQDLQKHLGFTAVYVTHDQLEAMVLSDHVVVMNEGEIIQEDTPYNIYKHPANEVVANFIGTFNFIQGMVGGGERDNGGYEVWSDRGLKVVCDVGRSLSEGQAILLMIRPETIRLYNQRPANRNIKNLFKGRIKKSMFLGNMMDYIVEVAEHELKVEDLSRTMYGEGDTVYLSIPPREVEVITQ